MTALMFSNPFKGPPTRAPARKQWLAAVLFGVLVAALPAARAQQQRTVDCLRINIGVVTATWAQRFPEERATHPDHGKPGADHHLVVSIVDANGGTPVTAAEVRAEVRGPGGTVQAKELLPSQAGGVPDYSGLFDMQASGLYRITVHVKTGARNKPLAARFEWTNTD